MYNPTTKECVWRSTNVTNFVCPPPGYDKRSCKSDQFSITYKATPGSDSAEKLTILANATEDVQISLDITRTANAPGWKIGKGPKGGCQYYGPDIEKPEGHLFHCFWPRTQCSGTIIYKGRAITANGHGMYVHAVMGMRPNLIASRWNFADFQSNEHGGVSAIQMELTTLDAYGLKGAGSGGVKVNFGSLVLGGKLVSVTTEVTLPGGKQPEEAKFKSRAFHYNLEHDADTDYDAPKTCEFVWAGPTTPGNPAGEVSASLKLDVTEGLIEKVDVLAEIPAMVKAVISYVAGTKPYVYQVNIDVLCDYCRLTKTAQQWMNPSELRVTCPDDIIPGGSSGISIKGTFYNEASFIS